MTLKLCVAQLNFIVGDLEGNVKKIVDAATHAYAEGARAPGVEAAGARERRVEHVGPVGGGEHHHALLPREPVHLGQDLVERLLALVRSTERDLPARTPDRVALVDKDDRLAKRSLSPGG